ncbi:MAG TPA: O-antigen ligase family protein [Anaeromyxobacteraceae bacterium]|nr:O-antigen ligase family protein [Anaeromyxobacteraceae bacterium]
MELQWAGAGAPEFVGREAGLAHAADRWRRLAFVGACLFVIVLYASPTHWWDFFEKFRLAVVSMLVCAGAIVMRRLTAGERIRMGGVMTAPLVMYALLIPLSVAWSIKPAATVDAMFEIAKLFIVFVAIQNSVDEPRRMRTLFVVASIAALAPAVGGVRIWVAAEELIEGYRTHWYGVFRDPNRLAMALVAILPMTLAATGLAKRVWLKALLGFSAAAQIAAIVLTHSRSGAVAAALAAALYLFRGNLKNVARGAAVAVTLAVALAILAPQSFWQRSSTITSFEGDASVAGRERAWQLLVAIFEERPLGGVGAGGFIHAWDTYAPLSAGGRHLVAHNIFMEILGELGIFGLLFFFGFAAVLLLRLFVAGRDLERGLEARVLFASISGYLVCLLVNGYSLSWWLYLLFGLAVASLRMEATRSRMRAEELA